MPDYQNSKIYKLVCSETNRIYIGSTTQTLCKRKAQHKDKQNRCISRTFINPQIYLIENFSCNSKEEMNAYENTFIENMECVNKIMFFSKTKEEQRIQANEQKKYIGKII